MKNRILSAVIAAGLLLLVGCTRLPDLQSDEQVTMPENFIGVVSYADVETVRSWQRNDEPFVVLDVRTEEEYRNEGYAPDAVLHSYYLASRRRNKNLDFLEQVAAAFGPETRLLVLCSHGMRAT